MMRFASTLSSPLKIFHRQKKDKIQKEVIPVHLGDKPKKPKIAGSF